MNNLGLNYLFNFTFIIISFILVNLCLLFLEFNLESLSILLKTKLDIKYLSHKLGLILILSLICLLLIYDTSRMYINEIKNYSFTYFYNDICTKVYIYNADNNMALCRLKPYERYYGENSIKNKLKKFEKNVLKINNSPAINKLKKHMDNLKKYNNFINANDVKYFFDSLYNNYTTLNSEDKINSCISEFKNVEEKLEKLNIIMKIDLSTIKEFYYVINEEQNSYFK